MTNSHELEKKWEESTTDHTLAPETHGAVLKVLGLVWRPVTDDFIFDLRPLLSILKEKKNTKRSVLQTAARIYDPLGFLTAFTIRIKCMSQEMWETGLSWDEELPPDLTQGWQQWCSELPQLHQLAIPRWYHTDLQPEDEHALTLRALFSNPQMA